ncbi:MAG: DUF1211 domain-containing protein [Actinobacteria bacterium]|nr:DUF1211 domain-containing protein [Actinomycetota bacterium]
MTPPPVSQPRPGPGGDPPAPDEQRETQARSLDRLVFFSDAVVAIAITLLALDLPVPEGDTAAAFWSSARDNAGHYAAFLISFAVIAGAWSNHHDLFRYARRTDSRLRTFTMIWLLMIVLTPFATKMLTVRGHETPGAQALRFGFYAVLQVLQAGALLAMLRHMMSEKQMPGLPPGAANGMAWAAYVVMLGFGLSIPLFFLTPRAWLLWIAFPLLAGALRRRLRRSRGAGG